MKARAVRLKVSMDVPASLSGQRYELIDISVTGALGLVDQELELGSEQPFRLGYVGDSLHLSARVVRVEQSPSELGRWRTAIAFQQANSGMQREIATRVSRLLATPPPRLRSRVN